MEALPGRLPGLPGKGIPEPELRLQTAQPLGEVVHPLQLLGDRQGQRIVDVAGDLVGGEAPVVAPPELPDAEKRLPQCPAVPRCAALRQTPPEAAGVVHLPPEALPPPAKLLRQVRLRQLPPPLPGVLAVQAEGIEERRQQPLGGLPGDGAALAGGIEPGLPPQQRQQLSGELRLPGHSQLIHAAPPLPPGGGPPAPSWQEPSGSRPWLRIPWPWRR